MAEEKKPAPPKDSAPAKEDPFVEIVWGIVVLLIIVYALNGFISAFSNSKIFSNGLQGMTPRGILLAHTVPISSLENPIGAKVVNLNDSNVYSSPGGFVVGKHKMGDRGIILQGPVEIDGERYWYVDYESGTDGWVKESDIAHLVSEPNLLERMIINIFSIYGYLRLIAILICIIAIIWIAYLIRKLTALRINEANLLYPQSAQITSSTNPQWERILNHIESLNENDWRLAILEADIMLGDILDRMSLPGESIGEKLKAVEKSDFLSIDSAWEAHKTRNQIAHEGHAFVLTQKKAKEIIDQYRAVFEEFHIV